ncbi:MAG: hypothetical protein JJ868_09645 [Shimia sp.]|uniref:hypothetical protein n=1 Tax=Shimia sp. TaxID=1954381 RepID=UPI0019FDCB45|nr:hypothetical protein [Shimia sp.]MBE1291170.1 hypothetical protein [Paracoccaceae bacterium]MBO6897623.1 hypothetical protein [Shimia sp.]
MPVSLTIIPELNLVHIIYSGRVTPQELFDETQACYQRPEYRSGMAEISDFFQVTSFEIGYDEMHDFTTRSQSTHGGVGTGMDICLVGSTKVSEPAILMYEGLIAAKEIPIRLHVVPGYPEALAMLDLPEDSLKYFPERCRSERHLL